MENVNSRNPPPTPGDRIPDLLLPSAGGNVVSLYDKSRGYPMVVVFTAAVRETVAALAAALTSAEVPDLDVFVISAGGGGDSPVAGGNAIHRLHDPQGRAPDLFGFRWSDLGGQTRVYLLDENQRLLEQFFAGGDGAVAACIDYVKALEPGVEAARPSRIAPVLMIPRVFEPDFCRFLIDAFHNARSRGKRRLFAHGRRAASRRGPHHEETLRPLRAR